MPVDKLYAEYFNLMDRAQISAGKAESDRYEDT